MNSINAIDWCFMRLRFSHSRRSRFFTGKVTIVGFFSMKKLFFENLFTARTRYRGSFHSVHFIRCTGDGP